MTGPEQEMITNNVRRAAGINALQRIGAIVAREQKADDDKARLLRWFACYSWLAFAGLALLLSYVYGLI